MLNAHEKPTVKSSDARQILAALTRTTMGGRIGRVDSGHNDGRIDLNVGVLIVPLSDECPDIGKAFTALTKDVGATDIGLVSNRSLPTSEALLHLAGTTENRLLRTTVRSRKNLGQGWVRFDMEVTGVLDKSEYPQLKSFVGSIMS
jgi:hypothetical protein